MADLSNYLGSLSTLDGYVLYAKQNPDGSIGVDYFDPSGKPITNAEFAAGNGWGQEQITNIERDPLAAVNQYLGPLGTNITSDGTIAPTTSSSYAPSGYTSGTPTAEPVWEPRYFQNKLYTDQDAFNQAQLAAANEEYQRQYGRGQTLFGQQFANLEQQRGNVGYDFMNALRGLTEGRDQSLQSQAGYFSAISPEAYQSQQGAYAGKTNKTFDLGQQDLTRQKTQALGSIDTAAQNLTTGQQDFYRALDQNKLSLLDQLGNASLDYTKNIPQAGTQYKQGALSGAPYANTLAGFNLTPGQRQGTGGRLNFANFGFSPEQQSAIEQAIYGA